MPSVEDRMALDRAIKKALEKERAERGYVEIEKPKVTYMVHLDIGGKLLYYKNTNLDAFIKYIQTYQRVCPTVKIYLFTHTEPQSDNLPAFV